MSYLWFTRKIHHLWLDDVTKPEREELVTVVATQEKRQAYEIRAIGIR